jgi:hypothetical protein
MVKVSEEFVIKVERARKGKVCRTCKHCIGKSNGRNLFHWCSKHGLRCYPYNWCEDYGNRLKKVVQAISFQSVMSGKVKTILKNLLEKIEEKKRFKKRRK